MKTRKGFIVPLTIFIIAVVALSGGYYYYTKTQTNSLSQYAPSKSGADPTRPLASFGDLKVTIASQRCELNLSPGDSIHVKGGGLKANSQAIVMLVTNSNHKIASIATDSDGSIDTTVSIPKDFFIGLSFTQNGVSTNYTGVSFNVVGIGTSGEAVLLVGGDYFNDLTFAGKCISKAEFGQSEAQLNATRIAIDRAATDKKKQEMLQKLVTANFTAYKITATSTKYNLYPLDYEHCTSDSSFTNYGSYGSPGCKQNKDLFQIAGLISYKSGEGDWIRIYEFPLADPESFPACPGQIGGIHTFKATCMPLKKTPKGTQIYVQGTDPIDTADLLFRKGNTGVYVKYHGKFDSQYFHHSESELSDLMTMIDSMVPMTPAEFVKQLPY